jgi:hypothetical protein
MYKKIGISFVIGAIFCLLPLIAQEKMPGGYWEIRWADTKLCIDQIGDDLRNPAAGRGLPFQLGQSQRGVADQLYAFIDAGDGWYTITAKNGMFLGMQDDSGREGTPVTVWTANRQKSQLFRFERNNRGMYAIIAWNGSTVSVAYDDPYEYSRILLNDSRQYSWMLVDPYTGEQFVGKTGEILMGDSLREKDTGVIRDGERLPDRYQDNGKISDGYVYDSYDDATLNDGGSVIWQETPKEGIITDQIKDQEVIKDRYR